MIRMAVLACIAIAAAAASVVSGQVSARQQAVVMAPSVAKSISSQKSRSKKPMTERVGMKRAPTSPTVNARTTRAAAPTSVRSVESLTTVR